MHSKSKRLLAALIALCLLVGIPPLEAAATYEQIGPYKYIGADNQITDASPNQPQRPTIAEENGFVEMSKAIETTSRTNEFIITLNVETTELKAHMTETTGADVVLVFDVSTSMDHTVDGVSPIASGWSLEKTRWSALKTAAASFITGLLESGQNRVSIVVYGGSNNENVAKKVHATLCDWTSDTKTAIDSFMKYAVVCQSFADKEHVGQAGHTSLRQDVFGDAAYAYGATNIQAGFVAAQTALEGRDPDNTSYVVLMSDGATNRNYWQAKGSDHAAAIVDRWSDSYYDRQVGGTHNATAVAGAINQATRLITLNPDTIIYTVGFGLGEKGNTVMSPAGPNGNGAVTRYYPAESAGDLNIVYGNINKAIELRSKAWQVSDPMGDMIEFVALESPVNDTVASEIDGTLNWSIRDDDYVRTYTKTIEEREYTFFVYELKYRIRLKTETPGFEDDIYYPANRRTELTYSISDDKGNLDENGFHTAYFNIPTIRGTAPRCALTVEHYLMIRNGSYALHLTERVEDIPLWAAIDADTYAKPGFDGRPHSFNPALSKLFAGDSPAAQWVVSQDGMTLKLYYDAPLFTVTVEHYYRTHTIDSGGILIPGEYPADPDAINYYQDIMAGHLFKSTPNTQGGLYTLDKAEPGQTIIVDTGTNVVRMYYERTIDNRPSASLQVTREFHHYSYALNDEGKYELVCLIPQPDTRLLVDKVPTPFNWSYKTVEEGYELVAAEFNRSPIPQADNIDLMVTQRGMNTLYLLYETTDDQRGDPVDVTVEHHYTLRRQVIGADGQPTMEDVWLDVRGPDTVVSKAGYANESFAITDGHCVPTYSDGRNTHTFNTPALPGPITLKAQGNVVKLYYEAVLYLPQVSVTVNHHYTRWHGDIGSDGSIVWSQASASTLVTETFPQGDAVLLLGQKFEATLRPNGYTLDARAAERGFSSDSTTCVLGENTVINLYYDAEDNVPVPASVSVQHVYYKDVKTVVDGQIVTQRRYVGATSTETYWGEAGSLYTIGERFTFGGETYTRRIDSLASLNVPYNGGTYVLEYAMDSSDLEDAQLAVTHSYFTRSMTVENGKADYYAAAVPVGSTPTFTARDKSGQPVSTFYAGMAVTIQLEYTLNGETFTLQDDSDPPTLLLARGSNSLSFRYQRKIPLPTVDVVVNHTYRETVYSYPNGVETIRLITNYGKDNGKTAATLYLGEHYAPRPDPQGFTLDSAQFNTKDISPKNGVYTVETVSGDNVVSFAYSKITGKKSDATVAVNHYYTEIDHDGKLTGYRADPARYVPYTVTVDSGLQAGTPYTATLRELKDDKGQNGYTLYDQKATPDFTSPLTITLAKGRNEINLFYSRKIDSRVNTSIRVLHRYHSTADVSANAYNQVTQVYNTLDQGVWVGNTFTAKQRDISDHRFHSSTPAKVDGKISVILQEENSDIILNYVPTGEGGGTQPTVPQTTQPEPTVPQTTRPGPTEPQTTRPGPTEPQTTQPGPTEPQTTQPGPTVPQTTQPPEEDITITDPAAGFTTLPQTTAPPDEDITMGDDPLADLPATGVLGLPVNPVWTLGTLALMAALAVAIGLGRKKEES